MRTRKRSALLVGLAAGLALAGCGGGSAADSGGGSDDPIKIMQITQPPVNNQDLRTGVKAAVQAINADGGIGGRQVEYLFCSSGQPPLGDPNTTLACARKAVQEDVLALVGSFQIYSKQIFSVIEKAGIPSIFDIGAVNADNVDDDSYVTAGTGYTILAGQGFAMAKAGCARPVIITRSDIPTNAEVAGSFAAGAKAGGAQPLEAIGVPGNTLDFTAAVARARDAGADCIGNGYPTTAQTQPMLQAIEKTGGDMKMSVNVSVLSQGALKSLGPLAEGVIGADTAYVNAPATPDDTEVMTPEQKQMIADIEKYEPAGRKKNHQPWAGYAATKVFAAAAEQAVANDQPLTPKSIQEALKGMENLETGIVPPLNFSEPGPITCQPRVFNTKINIFEVRNGELQAMSRKSFDMAEALSGAPALNSLC